MTKNIIGGIEQLHHQTIQSADSQDTCNGTIKKSPVC